MDGETTQAIEEYVDSERGRLGGAEEQRCVLGLYRRLARGEPVTDAALARDLGESGDRVGEILALLPSSWIERDGEGLITGVCGLGLNGDAPPVGGGPAYPFRVVRLRLPFPSGNIGPGTRRRFHLPGDGSGGSARRRPRRCYRGAAPWHRHVLRDPRYRRTPPRSATGFLPPYQLLRLRRGGGNAPRRR